MALYAVSITKRMQWHGKLEEYDNVYHYNGPDATPPPDQLNSLINIIAGNERQMHGVRVEFVRGRVWTAGGTPAENVTLALIDLSGNGTAVGAAMFGEAAVVVEWECSRRDINGRKVYLKKFYRPGNAVGGASEDSSDGIDPLSPGAKDVFKGNSNANQRVEASSGVFFNLTSPAGRTPRSANNAVCNEYLRSREFRRN